MSCKPLQRGTERMLLPSLLKLRRDRTARQAGCGLRRGGYEEL